MTNEPQIFHWLELRGPKHDKHWVVVFRNWKDNTIAEYPGETIQNCNLFLQSKPRGEGLTFRKVVPWEEKEKKALKKGTQAQTQGSLNLQNSKLFRTYSHL